MPRKIEQSGPKSSGASSSSAQGSTILRTDTCASSFQDAAYGRGVRVFNAGKGKVRCTVCKHEVMT